MKDFDAKYFMNTNGYFKNTYVIGVSTAIYYKSSLSYLTMHVRAFAAFVWENMGVM